MTKIATDSARSVRQGLKPSVDHLTALQQANDPATLMHIMGQLFESKGLKTPWALPELTPLSEFALDHLRRKAKKVTPSTLSKLKEALVAFCKVHRKLNLQDIRGHHVQSWTDSLATLAPGTLSNKLSALNAMFCRAVSLGHLTTNPCADVELPTNGSVVDRKPMSDGQVETLLAWLQTAQPEAWEDWQTVILLSRHAGARLGDSAKMDRSAAIFENDMTLLRYQPQKTKRHIPMVEIPVFEPLASRLRMLAILTGPMCPTLCKAHIATLSRRFGEMLDEAGIDREPVTLPSGHVCHRISHHSLKHSRATHLAVLGVPLELRKATMAHSSDSSHRTYVHLRGADTHKQLAEYFPA